MIDDYNQVSQQKQRTMAGQSSDKDRHKIEQSHSVAHISHTSKEAQISRVNSEPMDVTFSHGSANQKGFQGSKGRCFPKFENIIQKGQIRKSQEKKDMGFTKDKKASSYQNLLSRSHSPAQKDADAED